MDHWSLKHRDDRGPRTVRNLAAHFQNLKNIDRTAQNVERMHEIISTMKKIPFREIWKIIPSIQLIFSTKKYNGFAKLSRSSFIIYEMYREII